ncbi:MAG: SsrA-binding protein SmpB [Elusimicrobiales bacterium]|nr:SsrA-binding protein SmpB [Elusimicrobiales bacterium]
MKKNEKVELIATNRRAKFDYEIFDIYTAGIELKGPEIKSIRQKHVNINSAFIKIENGEAFVYGMQITPYQYNTSIILDPFRKRKLLLHKNEIKRIKSQVEKKGFTIIVLELFLKNGWAKLKIAIARGKKKYNKKDYLKERDIRRETKKEIGI